MGLLSPLGKLLGGVIHAEAHGLAALLGSHSPALNRPVAPQRLSLNIQPNLNQLGLQEAGDIQLPPRGWKDPSINASGGFQKLMWGNNPQPVNKGVPLLDLYRNQAVLPPPPLVRQPAGKLIGGGPDSPYIRATPFYGAGNPQTTPIYYNGLRPRLPVQGIFQ